MASKKASSHPSSVPASAERARASTQAPTSRETSARRGQVRDALATLGNLEAVLRSRSRVPGADEIEELRRGLGWLREAFAAALLESSAEQRAAREALDAFAAERIAAVEAALGGAPDASTVALLARAVVELDAAAGLLELAERAADAAPVEVSVATLAEQALQLAWANRSQGAVGVHVRAPDGDCSVSCDPHVVARVLAIAVATVRDVSPAVVVRTHVEPDAGVIEVTAYTAADAGAAVTQTRLVARVAPTAEVLAAAARSAGLGLVVEAGRVLVRCPRTSQA